MKSCRVSSGSVVTHGGRAGSIAAARSKETISLPVLRPRQAGNQRTKLNVAQGKNRGESSEAAMLLMCLPLIICQASLQMFLDGLRAPDVSGSGKPEAGPGADAGG
jgi:hypothetical protein